MTSTYVTWRMLMTSNCTHLTKASLSPKWNKFEFKKRMSRIIFVPNGGVIIGEWIKLGNENFHKDFVLCLLLIG
jgi:hypothetical protein